MKESLSALGFVVSMLSLACAAETKVTPSSNVTCNADSECHLESDYCTSCDCRALGPGEKLAKCPGPGVRCVADPCRGKVAKCVEHHCVAG